jgi:hypothetical protein
LYIVDEAIDHSLLHRAETHRTAMTESALPAGR